MPPPSYEQHRLDNIRKERWSKIPFYFLEPKALQALAMKIGGLKEAQMPLPNAPTLVIGADGVAFNSFWATVELVGAHAVIHMLGLDYGHRGFAHFPLVFCGKDVEHQDWMRLALASQGSDGENFFYVAVLGTKNLSGGADPLRLDLRAFRSAMFLGQRKDVPDSTDTFCPRCDRGR